MNISQLIIGLIFLINPNINIVDLLPDAVGIALIISAISKPALVYDCMYSTKLSFQKLLYVEIAKAAALILLPISDDTMVLTLTFAFLILELIFAPNAFYKLLDSIVYTGSLNNSSSVFKNLTDTKVMCMVFVIARPILNVIPEFTALAPSSNEYVYSGVAAGNVATIKKFLIVGCFLLSVIAGILFAYYMISYFRGIRKDTPFLDKLNLLYEEKIKLYPYLIPSIVYRKAFISFAFGLVFFFDFFIDRVNVLPDFIGCAFILFSLWQLKKYHNNTKNAFITTYALAFVSAVTFAVNCVYAYIWVRPSFHETTFLSTLKIAKTVLCSVENIFIVILLFLIINIFASLTNNRSDLTKLKISKILSILFAVSSVVYEASFSYILWYYLLNSAFTAGFIYFTLTALSDIKNDYVNKLSRL